MSARFPFPMPFGWFAACKVDDIPDGGTIPLSYVGEELVAWRQGQEVHLNDAYCPHLGAHLGVGGRVVDDCLVCPFHEWTFNAEGRNVDIPYAERPNKKARIRTYPTIVRNGFLLFWYHPDAEQAPLWEIPEELMPADFVLAGAFEWQVNTAWQEIAENSVDMAHFKSVHGLTQVADISDLTMDGPFRTINSTQAFNTAKGVFEGKLQSNSLGPGLGVTHFDLMGRVTLLSMTTPIDDDSVRVRFSMFHAPTDEIAAKIATPFAEEVKRQFEEDMPIWESKRFVPTPALAPTERPVTEFRRWASQFYATPEPV